MIYRYFIFLSLIFATYNCRSPKKAEQSVASYKESKVIKGKYTIHFDSLRISTPISDGPFGNYTTTYTLQDTSFLVLEDCLKQQLVVINIANGSFFSIDEKQIKCGLSHNLSMESKNHFFKLDVSGDLLEFRDGKYTLIDNLTENAQLNHWGLWAGGTLNYSNEFKFTRDSTILFPLDINPDFSHKKFSKYDYGYPITGMYDLKTKKIDYEGITWPEFLFKNNFGILTEIEQTYTAENIFYSFVPVPEIWRYNRKRKTVDRFLVKSSFDTIATPTLTFKRTPKTKDLVFRHFKTSPHYKRLIYDPTRHLFYRFYALPVPEKAPDGLYTTYKDRRYSVMVLNEDFDLLAEAILPDECFFIYFAVLAKDGLYINYGPSANTKQHGIKTLHIQLVDPN